MKFIRSDILSYDRVDDPANSIAAGAISGMIFKSTKGTKPMLISGGLVATAAGVWAVSITFYTNGLLDLF